MRLKIGSEHVIASMMAAVLYELAEKFENTYVIDLMRYAPVYDKKFHEKFYMRGHLNPMGYYLTAQLMIT